jgi:serine/threonine protein kinase
MMREVSAGDRLDHYQLTELIARSGMASIFKAEDRMSGATVAIKVPYLEFESDVVFYGRFQREEEIGRRLDHPNIVKVLSPPRHRSRMYIVMEYVDGVSLREIMRGERPLRIARALDFACQLCEAMVYMHGQGVVHRDLKPENALVTTDGKLKLMDFGIALDQSARRLTWSGLSTTIGTPDYMAPEQVSGRHGDVRTDIYALGTMLFEMVTGNLPFAESNVYAMMRAKATADPRPPSSFVLELDSHLEEIILRAIARVPRTRYQSAVEMLADLKDPPRVAPIRRAPWLRPRSLRAKAVQRVLWAGLLFFGSLAGIFVLIAWLASRYPVAPPRADMTSHGELK